MYETIRLAAKPEGALRQWLEKAVSCMTDEEIRSVLFNLVMDGEARLFLSTAATPAPASPSGTGTSSGTPHGDSPRRP